MPADTDLPLSADLVPVGYAYGPMEAAIAFSMLDAAGIIVHVQTQQMGSNAWHNMTALGGMAILVPDAQASDAEALLADFHPARRWRLGMVIFSIVASLALAAALLPASGFFRLQRPPATTLLGTTGA
jgi:hypothetical protein